MKKNTMVLGVKFLLRLLMLFSLISSLIYFPRGVQAQGLSFPAEINKEFTPISISSGGISRLRVTIFNPNLFELTNAAWADNLVGVQPGLLISNPVNLTNTCGGTVIAPAGGTSFSLSGGTVPPQVGFAPGECTVSIDVTSTTPGNLINTIPADGLTGTGGGGTITNTTPASATITVLGVSSPSLTKGFAPNTIFIGEHSRLTITLNNNDNSTNLTGTSYMDTLPSGLVLATPVNATVTGCGAGYSLTANAGASTIAISGATVLPSPNCVVSVDVTGLTGTYTNTIPAGPNGPGSVQTDQGVTNNSPASANLNIQPVNVEKSFSPTSFEAGGTTTLTITLENPTGSDYTGVGIADTLPGVFEIANPANVTNTCGGTLTAVPGTQLISLSGGTIPASATPPTPVGSCVITVQVTAPAGSSASTSTNIIPANTLTADQPGVTNITDATANVSVYAVGTGLSASKSFSPSTIDPGENTRLRINMRAPQDTDLTNFSFTDNLPAGVTISNSAGPNVNNGCGTGYVLTAVTGATSISLTNGTILAGQLCRIDVWVTSSTPGLVTNTITPADISNDQNRDPSGNINANLNVRQPSNLTVSKAFYPNQVTPNGISTVTITLENTNDNVLVNVSLIDNLATMGGGGNAVRIAATPNASTTCGGTLTAAAGTQIISLSGGTILAQSGGIPGTCTISVDVQAGSNISTNGRLNTIPLTNVSADISGTGTTINPLANATARLFVLDLSIGVVKGFDPVLVYGGASSTMSVQLINPNNATLVGITFTDDMTLLGTGMIIANPANFNVGSCQGGLTGNPGDTSFLFSGGILPPNSSCTLTLSVTMTVTGNRTNIIPAGAVTTLNGVTSPDPTQASLTNLPGASVSKAFSPNPINVGAYSLLTITIQNTGNIPLTGMGLSDTLPGSLPVGLEVAGASAPAPVNNCGGSLTAVAGTQSIQLINGAVAASSSCTIVVAVTSDTPGSYQNIIPAGSLSSTEGATNNSPATDTLVVLDAVTASLGDFVWNDLNADGIQDSGELGIDGVTVNLYAGDGTFITTTTTAGGGLYLFDNLTPGDYYVEFIPPIGYVISLQDQGGDTVDSDANPTTGQTITTTLVSGENDLTWDAGLHQLASLGDFVWNDLNANGVQDGGEAGINGVTVNLYRPGYGPDGIPGNGDDSDIVATDVTAGGGLYLFDNLTPGDYYVEFIPPAGYTISPQDQGGDTADSDADPTTGQTIPTTLVAGENDLTWDAGLYQPTSQLASLGNRVWSDVDADGIQDGGEAGIAGVTVNLYRPGYGPDGIPGNSDDGDIVATTTTSSTGLYLFEDLDPGDYYVDFIPPSGYVISPRDQGGNDAIDSDADPATGQTITTTLVAGENDLTWDAGLYRQSTGGGGGGGNPTPTPDPAPIAGGFLIPVTGFAPNVVTDMSQVPSAEYANTSITLDIPSLSVNIPIVGVPKQDGAWNVSWLGNQAGWLEGSAFPSWNGNSVLTSHVYLSNGKPGPFAKLHELKTGDQIFVHAFGQTYTFTVLTNAIIAPTDRSVMQHEERPWLTLVTCTDYDPVTGTYQNRFIVRAVLVKVSADK